eukprot:1571518-Alexandrium_andersonii.AAC.1
MVLVMHACPRCERSHPAGALDCEDCSLSMRAQNGILRSILRSPEVRPLFKIRADEWSSVAGPETGSSMPEPAARGQVAARVRPEQNRQFGVV